MDKHVSKWDQHLQTSVRPTKRVLAASLCCSTLLTHACAISLITPTVGSCFTLFFVQKERAGDAKEETVGEQFTYFRIRS